jgi:hypothetical protein
MYGKTLGYTPQQIQRGVEAAKLDSRFIALAYAAYLTETEFNEVAPVMPRNWTFESARALFWDAAPVDIHSRAENPVRENPEFFWGADS